MPKTMNKHHQKAATTMTHNTTAPNTAVPALRFPEFQGDKGWVEKKLGDIATFKKGKGISKADITEDGCLPCIRYGELYTHYQEIIDHVLSYTNVQANNLVLSRANDVIIPASGETHKDIATATCVKNSGVALGGDLNIIRSPLDGVFLSYYLNSAKKYEISTMAQGVSVIHLYATQLKSLIIHYPKKEEQQKIADCLASIDAQITAEGDYLQALHSHKQGLLQQLFPTDGDTVPQLRFNGFDGKWAEEKLGKIGKFTGGGTPSKANEAYWQGKYPWISSSDISEDSIYQIDIRRYITQEAIENSATKKVPKDSILILSRVGIGKIAISYDEIYTSQDFTNLTPSKDNLLFLAYQLKAKAYKFSDFSQGMGIQGFTKDDISNFEIKLPYLQEQQKIADCLSSLDDLITAQADKIDALKQHKQGLMQQLFPRMDK